MRFSTEQRYRADVAQVVALFTDPDLYPTLSGLPKIGTPEVVEHVVDGSHVRLGLRQHFIGDLPAAALAVIDPAKLTWVEVVDYDLDQGTATTRLRPDHYADRLTCSGRYTFLADGPGSIRRLDGELKVRMPLVGGKVEGALVSGLREHAADEQRLVARRLAEG
jgi:hypothetical protein